MVFADIYLMQLLMMQLVMTQLCIIHITLFCLLQDVKPFLQAIARISISFTQLLTVNQTDEAAAKTPTPHQQCYSRCR